MSSFPNRPLVSLCLGWLCFVQCVGPEQSPALTPRTGAAQERNAADPTASSSRNTGASDAGAPGPFESTEGCELRWSWTDPVLGEIPVVVIVPARAKAEDRLPVLVAFHGRGESQKGPARGVRGWLDDYQLGHTLERLAAPPLTRDDFKGFVTDSRLKEHNARLQRQPYRPLIIVMPYLPDALKRVEVFDNGAALATLIVDRVLPRVYSETPARVGATGVDGVSLGGRASLLVGLSRPRAFAVVGAMQAALDDSELDAFAALGEQAHRANPRLELRLLTTRDDPFLDVNTELHARLERRAVPSELRVVPGPHSYTFNRGPGGYEMLLFQESELYDLGEP